MIQERMNSYGRPKPRTAIILVAGWIGAVLAFPAPCGAAFPAAKCASFLAANKSRILEEFAALLSIPNTAAEKDGLIRNAERIAAMLERRGAAAKILDGAGGPPLVYGEIKAPGARRTVLFYAHYDGQPVQPAQWAGDPWKAVYRDKRIEAGGRVIAPSQAVASPSDSEVRVYARSAADDKAPIIGLASALDFLRAAGIPLVVNVKFIFEGEEESGSPHLKDVLGKNRALLAADGMFICDGPVDTSGRKALLFGARGNIGLEMTVYGPNHPLHSGHYGNWAPNPIALLAELLTGLRDSDGLIRVKGFYDRVRPLGEEERQALRELPDVDERLRSDYGLAWSEAANARLTERILMPALNFRGVQSGAVGSLAANAVPPEAKASIDFRLVPDQTPEDVRSLIEAHIQSKGFHIVRTAPTEEERKEFARLIRLEWEDGYPSYRLAMNDPFGKAAIQALTDVLGTPPLKIPSVGGSVPMRFFADALGCPVLVLGIANIDNNQHGPNENLRLSNLWDGIAMFAGILSGAGGAW